jgi:hypothetical protein
VGIVPQAHPAIRRDVTPFTKAAIPVFVVATSP